MTGPGNRETRPTGHWPAVDWEPYAEELEARCVRAEEALRDVAHLVRYEWRKKHHDPGIVLATIEQILVAAVPEKDKP